MGSTIITHIDEATFVQGQGTPPGSVRTRAKQFIGDQTAGPWIGIVSQEPDLLVPPHSHGHDETLYVIEGSLIIGGRVCSPGTVLYVEKDTVYGFVVGPEGVRFMTVRPGPPATKFA